jgi:Right handed beta helix region
MKDRLAAFACFVFMICMNSQAMSAVYYVAQTGSDSNPGTAAAPFRTITYANSRVVAGDTINVGPGTYTDYSNGQGIYLHKSGSSGKPITLKSTVRGAAVIDGTGTSYAQRPACIYMAAASWWIIDGFTIRNCSGNGIKVTDSGGVVSTNNQILRNEIYNIVSNNTGSTGQGGQGISEEDDMSCTCNNTYSQNYVHDVGAAWDNTYDHGFYVNGGGNVYTNNIASHNPYGNGYQLSGYYATSNVKFYNNIGVNNANNGVVIWTSGGSFTNLDMANNIFYGNGWYGIDACNPTATNVTMENNISYNNAYGAYVPNDCGGSGAGLKNTNMIQSDPKFLNSTSDWNLQAGSPGIGAAIASPLVTVDYVNNPRPSTGVTIGAYQYNTAYTPPPSSATFVKFDTTTKGSWSGVYGADGYVVSQDSNTKIPTYAQISSAGLSNYIWNSSTSDIRALMRPENLSTRIAATWYSGGSLSISTNLTDGNPHQIALYLLDWDSTARAETVTVTNATTGAILDTRVLPAGTFTNGEYAVWTVTGNVKFQVTRNSGANAVVSGIFFR